KPKRSWPFLAETSAAARARRSLTEIWSTTTFTPFFCPHSGQYFLSNHSSKAGTKCVHCPILSVSDLARAERTMMVGPTAAAVATRAFGDTFDASGWVLAGLPCGYLLEPVGCALVCTKGAVEFDSRHGPATASNFRPEPRSCAPAVLS